MKFLLLLLVACGAAGHSRPTPTTGAITGLVRDATTIDPLTGAEVEIAGQTTKADKAGIYLIDNLAPGRYTLNAKYAGQPITIKNIEVVRGMATYVDVSFKLGEPGDVVVDWSVSRENEIVYFESPVPRIEGTVGDSNTRGRVAGAVVTAAGPGEALQTVTDDAGRYRFDLVPVGTYTVSAYYSIAGRGQVEVRRSDVKIEQGKGALVPLWIELAK